MSNVRFRGIIPAIVSPLNEDGTVREKVLRDLMNWQLAAGCSGFYICGGTGEGVVMRPDARKKMAEIAVDEIKGRGFIIDHIGAVDLSTAIDLARHASSIGVDAISSLPPFFYRYDEREIIQFYRALADSSDVAMIIYASPLSEVNISKNLVEKLLQIHGIIGVKFTSYNYYEMHRIKELNNGDVNVINGPDETLLCGLIMNADGGIGSTYNVIPKVFVDLYRNFMEGKMDEARSLQFKANRVIEILFKYGILAGIKNVLEMIGFNVGYYTYPLKRLTSSEQESLRNEIKGLNFEDEYL